MGEPNIYLKISIGTAKPLLPSSQDEVTTKTTGLFSLHTITLYLANTLQEWELLPPGC